MRPNHRHQRHDLGAIARRAMIARGLEPDFPAAVVAEVNALASPATDAEPAIRDLRSLPWCSIDNDDSRDLDQLSVAEALPGGAVKVLVAVADVDALVAKDSATDDHARTNTTSVYTAAEIFPMLPLRLSTDLTSLNEDEERLAIVVEMVVRRDGAVADATIYRARVLNRAKLAYRTVGAWLEGRGPAPARLAADKRLAEQLRLQADVAETLRALRHERGALILFTSEPPPGF